MYPIPDISLAFLAAALTVTITLSALVLFSRSRTATQGARESNVTLLFDKGVLQHSTGPASQMFGFAPGQHDWSDLRDSMLARFPDFPVQPTDVPKLSLVAMDNSAPHEIDIRSRDGKNWVRMCMSTYASLGASGQGAPVPNAALQRAANTAPHPIWEEDQRGTVVWFNPAYAALYKTAHDQTEVDPHRPLFSQAEGQAPNRVTLNQTTDGAVDWFELTAVQSGDVTVFHANSINAVIAAEEAQRNFVQTLAKTFAHLSIGLAIFDRNNQLVLFNPALLDLTDLNAPFLSARPTMLSFFDALRENRRMPEPKNYRSWRQEIAEVIAAATDGRYCETWTLESGQTYSVNGRQHPDGATAFLFEDISAEMTLTRNFRTEMEQAQMMVNAVDNAMAIFLPSGVLALSNSAFCQQWGIDPDAAFADVTLHDCALVWKGACATTKDHKALDRALTGAIIGVPKKIPLTQKSGDLLHCEVTHLASGSLFVRFLKRDPRRDPTSLTLGETA